MKWPDHFEITHPLTYYGPSRDGIGTLIIRHGPNAESQIDCNCRGEGVTTPCTKEDGNCEIFYIHRRKQALDESQRKDIDNAKHEKKRGKRPDQQSDALKRKLSKPARTLAHRAKMDGMADRRVGPAVEATPQENPQCAEGLSRTAIASGSERKRGKEEQPVDPPTLAAVKMAAGASPDRAHTIHLPEPASDKGVSHPGLRLREFPKQLQTPVNAEGKRRTKARGAKVGHLPPPVDMPLPLTMKEAKRLPLTAMVKPHPHHPPFPPPSSSAPPSPPPPQPTPPPTPLVIPLRPGSFGHLSQDACNNAQPNTDKEITNEPNRATCGEEHEQRNKNRGLETPTAH